MPPAISSLQRHRFQRCADLRRLLLVATALVPFATPGTSSAQEVTPALLTAVFPDADRFSVPEGDPPVMRAYAGEDPERLVGYVFLTSDIPPESFGYNAPIEVLVGIDLDAVLTGARVVSYRESLRSTRGDFLARPGIQGQFAGKSITDPFRIRQDVQNITGATITVAAMALGIRNASRRVWAAYLREPDPSLAGDARPRIGTIEAETLAGLTWPEIVQLELAREWVVEDGSDSPIMLTLAYLRDEEVGSLIVGANRYGESLTRAGEAAEGHHIFVLGMNGDNVTFFSPDAVSFAQGETRIHVLNTDFITMGAVTEGRAQGEFRRAGLLLVDPALDVTQPFDIVVERGDEVVARGPYLVHDEPAPIVAEVEPPPDDAPTDGDPEVNDADLEPTGAPGADGGTPVSEVAAVPGPAVETGAPSGPVSIDALSDDDLMAFLFEDDEVEESVIARTLQQTSWARVWFMLLLLGLVTAAFVSKRAPLRAVALTGTVLFLGFVDRGFLSVSHIIAGIAVGPEVYLTDLSLLMLAGFTVVTTLLFGRVFCGFLCPFGAIQDFLERIVPRRFRRELPEAAHRRALWIKYGILGIVLLPVLAGIPITLFHYFEPFGTVFYWSPSVLLWSIAGGILIASAVVPRFYCRYACPLGAALALGSLLSPFRIRRVEQCTVCTVCERKCPTGAIRGAHIDFKECVRCNVCERQLIDRTGVCRHDMAKVRARLVQLEVGEKAVR